MKNKMLLIVIPTLTVISLAGSGYAVWYFNEGSSTSASKTSLSVDVEFTDAQELGQFTSQGDIYLYLDEPSEKGYGGEGVIFKEVVSTQPFSISFTSSSQDVQVNWTISKVSENLDEYLNIDIKIPSGQLDLNSPFTLTDFTKCVEVSYKEEKIPSNVEEYNTLKALCDGVDNILEIKFVASFSSSNLGGE